MTMLLLARVAKLAWLDQPEIKDGLALELLSIIGSNNPEHKLVGLTCINQLIEEMSYMTKHKNHSHHSLNRRISICFRDSALFNIFNEIVAQIKYFSDSLRSIH